MAWQFTVDSTGADVLLRQSYSRRSILSKREHHSAGVVQLGKHPVGEPLHQPNDFSENSIWKSQIDEVRAARRMHSTQIARKLEAAEADISGD